MTEHTTPSPCNETLLSIERRHSVRMFAHRPVSEEYVMRILRAANQAPSAHNTQSWRFIVVRGTKRTELGHLVASGAAAFPRPASTLLRMAARSIVSAPVVIAIANTGELIAHGTSLFGVGESAAQDFFRTMEIQNSAAAVENMLVAATSLGLATVWLGILFLIKDEVLHFLGERQGEFMAVVPVGYALRPATGPKKAPLERVVRYVE